MNDILCIAEAISLFCRLNMQSKKQLPIRSSEMGLLIYLAKHEGEKTPQAASLFFKVTKSMITNMVTSLTKQNYIQKKQSPIDKRSVILVPTEKALLLVDETYDEYVKAMSTLKSNMGESDFTTFSGLLNEANNILLELKQHG